MVPSRLPHARRQTACTLAWLMLAVAAASARSGAHQPITSATVRTQKVRPLKNLGALDVFFKK